MSLFNTSDSPETSRARRAPALRPVQVAAANSYAVNDRWPAARIAEDLMQRFYPNAVARLNAKMYGVNQAASDSSAQSEVDLQLITSAPSVQNKLHAQPQTMANLGREAMAPAPTAEPAENTMLSTVANTMPTNVSQTMQPSSTNQTPNQMSNKPYAYTAASVEVPQLHNQVTGNATYTPLVPVMQSPQTEAQLSADQAAMLDDARRIVADLHAAASNATTAPASVVLPTNSTQDSSYGLAA